MLITKREDGTKQGFCKLPPTLKKTQSSGESLYISTYSIFISLSSKWVGWGWALIRGWALNKISAQPCSAWYRPQQTATEPFNKVAILKIKVQMNDFKITFRSYLGRIAKQVSKADF